MKNEITILQADTTNGVSEYPNDPTNFETPANEIDFLNPELFYSLLPGLDDDEEIFCQIGNEDVDIYSKIKTEYGIR